MRRFSVEGTIRITLTAKFSATVDAETPEEAADLVLDEGPLDHEHRSEALKKTHSIEWYDQYEWDWSFGEWVDPPVVNLEDP